MSQAHLEQPRFLQLRSVSEPPLQLHAALPGLATWTKVAEFAAPAPGAASAMEEVAWPACTQGMPVRSNVPKEIRNDIRRHVCRLHARHVLRPLRICHTHRKLLGSTWVPIASAGRVAQRSFRETWMRVSLSFLLILRPGCPPVGRSIRGWSNGVGIGDFDLGFAGSWAVRTDMNVERWEFSLKLPVAPLYVCSKYANK